MMIQQQARKNLQERSPAHGHTEIQPGPRKPEEQVLRRFNSPGKYGERKVEKRKGKKPHKIAPVALVPSTLEEAPLRRMDRRALNALRKRRADKHMIACLIFTGLTFIMLGVGSIVVWVMFRHDLHHVGPLIILGPILVTAGLGLVVFSVELIIRLMKQIRRVMDPNLLKTNNLHEVKHWIEPELVSFGWGQFDMQEEAKLLDENNLRKHNYI